MVLRLRVHFGIFYSNMSKIHRSPIMQGNTEQQQLILISQLCGSITTEVWPGVEHLELYNKMDLPKGQKRKVSCDQSVV